MDAQVLARWQFAITTIYHFFFVPITIGMSLLVAIMETQWLRTGNKEWLKHTKFFSKLFLINFAAGVVTGIVQEFQFGMNWSEYSRFMGDIFGAPLALEALIAFFMESTFIGLWIFGWDKLSPKVHNLMMYLTAFATSVSAIFILAANSWMQNPVGATYNAAADRAELVDFSKVFTNPFLLASVPHTLGASFLVAGAIIASISGWKMAKLAQRIRNNDAAKSADSPEHKEHRTWSKTAKLGAWVMIAAGIVTALSGHAMAQIEAKYQPMKLAASEGLVETKTDAPFSIIGIYTQNRENGVTKVHEVWSLDVPYVVSFLAFNDPHAEVKGINELTEQYRADGSVSYDGHKNELQKLYGSKIDEIEVDPVPNVMVNYYSFRLMIGLGLIGSAVGVLMLLRLRKDRLAPAEGFGAKAWFVTMAVLPYLPSVASSFGWILTEMGRQPWIVYGVLPTFTAHSPNVSAAAVLFSTIGYTLIYAVVAVIVLKLFYYFVAKGLPDDVEAPAQSDDEDAPVAFAY